MVNLINLLVGQHVIAKEAGEKLIGQAEQEAAAAHAEVIRTQVAIADVAEVQTPAGSPQPPTTPNPLGPPDAPNDETRVTYVPDVVKNQIRDEVTDEVMRDAENGTLPGVNKSDVPDWVKRFHVAGDIRVREEPDFYPSSNAGGENFTNFNAINTGSPFNFGENNSNFPPNYNANQDRNRLRLRARIGAGIDLGENFTAGMRVATGSDDSPVTENQTLGSSNSGQGGNFGKYQIWLDRAFIRYEFGGQPDQDFSLTLGRFDNPFFHTSMIWSDDLAFDGFAAQGKYAVGGGVTPFLTAGVFPVFNTDLNFATNQPEKFSSEDKWLYAAQAGVDWKITKDWSVKGAAAYYYFDNIEGKVSDPFIPQSASDVGDTDDSRPSFAQNGNTYIALRDITPDASNDFGLTNQYQYFGLATPFHDFALTSEIDYGGFDPFHIWLTGEVVKNLAFDRNAIENNGPANAQGPQNNLVGTTFGGGDTGYYLRFNVGKVALERLGDWNVQTSYRHVESDATVDGFTDSDFGGSLAGTNLKGYTVGGNVALSSRVWATLRWMSSDAITGAPYHADVLQFDINAKF